MTLDGYTTLDPEMESNLTAGEMVVTKQQLN